MINKIGVMSGINTTRQTINSTNNKQSNGANLSFGMKIGPKIDSLVAGKYEGIETVLKTLREHKDKLRAGFVSTGVRDYMVIGTRQIPVLDVTELGFTRENYDGWNAYCKLRNLAIKTDNGLDLDRSVPSWIEKYNTTPRNTTKGVTPFWSIRDLLEGRHIE